MANLQEQFSSAVFAAQSVNRCARQGLVASDITSLANAQALITAIQTRRSLASTPEADFASFEALIQSIQVLINQKVVTDSNAALLVTVNANNGLTTDLLTLVGAAAVTATGYDLTRQEVTVFDAIQVTG